MSIRFFRVSFLILACLVFGSLLSASEWQAEAALSSDVGRPDQVTLTVGAGTGPALNSIGDGYLSPVTEAERPFTHMLLRWEVSGAYAETDAHTAADTHAAAVVHAETDVHSDTVVLEVRSSIDGQDWQPWVQVYNNEDLWMAEDGEDVHWSQVIYAAEGARFWQVRASLSPNADGELPQLKAIDVNTVDARFGEEQPASRAAAQTQDQEDQDAPTLASVPKPAVVSRTAWGNPDGQGSRASVSYHPVSHMVVHHTADPNTFRAGENSWGDRVRAIWSFHTFTRGWGDVGYNFLIDPNGVIYEGRAGGDNSVGFHDTGNVGSMGVSLIGTYSSLYPTQATQSSLVELLAWKASQRGINPQGSSYYYGCDVSSLCSAPGAVLPHISGHRHVTGRTSCPGDAAFELLPSFRTRVSERVGEGGPPTPFEPEPDNGDLTIAEREESFERSDANWYEGFCGDADNTFYTFATDSAEESTNSATWNVNLPSSGRYQVLASVPQGCGVGNITRQATYRISSADGDVTRVIDQNTAQSWVDLGTYNFNGGHNTVQLSDLTGEPFSERRAVFFDTIRWVPAAELDSDVELIDVQYSSSEVPAGELLAVTFTIKNHGPNAVEGQSPQVTDGSGAANGYVYDEGECFAGREGAEYPAHPKEAGRFRLTLGTPDREVACGEATGSYPWRWGIDGRLEPGETREIVGYVRFRIPGTFTVQAGLIEEYARYHSRDVGRSQITVVPERTAPVLASYNEDMQPLASVYRLGNVPANFLMRTSNPTSITRGEFVGTFAWDGNLTDWGDGGPLAMRDTFLIEQTRVFYVPTSGDYTFAVASSDGAWLWVNGQQVVVNAGLHDTSQASGTIALDAGVHVLSFKYFEHTGDAVAGYTVRAPGSSAFAPLTDALSSGLGTAGTLNEAHELVLAADDQGGSGIASVSYSWDGEQWSDSPGSSFSLGRLVAGTYTLSYRATDNAGNRSDVATLRFTVGADTPNEPGEPTPTPDEPGEPSEPSDQPHRVFLPLIAHNQLPHVSAAYPGPGAQLATNR